MPKLIGAEVKYTAGKVYTSKFGKGRQNVVFTPLDGGEDISIWFDEGDRRFVGMAKGECYSLLKEGDRYTLITEDDDEEEAAATPLPAAAPQAAKTNGRNGNGKTNGNGKNGNGNGKHNGNGNGQSISTEADKRKLYESICYKSKVLACCHTEIHKLFCDERGQLIITEETLQKYAVTIFLSVKDLV